jgi:hypothetical protein
MMDFRNFRVERGRLVVDVSATVYVDGQHRECEASVSLDPEAIRTLMHRASESTANRASRGGMAVRGVRRALVSQDPGK